MHHRDIHRQIRRSVGKGNAFHQRGVCINHRGSDVFIVLSHRLFKGFQRLMRSSWLDVAFSRTTPGGDQPACARCFLEVADVVAHLLREIHFVVALLDVRAINVFYVVVIEHRLARLHRRKQRLDLVEQVAFEDAGVGGRRVHVVFENIPASEYQVIETRQRHEFLQFRRAAISALPQPDRSHLGERAYGLRQTFADGFDAGHERRSHRAHARKHDAQLALGRRHAAAAVVAFNLCRCFYRRTRVLLPCRHNFRRFLMRALLGERYGM